MVMLSAPLTLTEYAEMDDDVLTCEPLIIEDIVAESILETAREESGAENFNKEGKTVSPMFSDAAAALDVLRQYVSTMDCVEGVKGLQLLGKCAMLKKKKQQETISDFFKPL